MIKRVIALNLSLTIGAAVIAAPAPVTDVNASPLEQRLALLERMVNARTSNQHRVQEQLDVLQNEVDELRGSLELHSHQLEKILQRQRELYLEIDKRIEEVQRTEVVSAPVETTPQQPIAESESDAYQRAVNLILKEKQYDQAIPEFQAFLSKFPSSSYTANAHYWLGQLLFNKQDWAGANEQFAALAERFTDSNKRPDALLKLGIIENKRANQAQAKVYFQQVVQEYANSSAATLAESELAKLN